MAIVYIHKKYSDDLVFYVGIGKTIKRAYSNVNRNKFWKHTVEKHGYTVEILKDNITWEQACLIEKELILKFGRKDLKTGSLVNLTNGGEGVLNYTYTDDVKSKMSLLKKGKQSPRKGIKLSQETKYKISNSKKGTKFSDIHKLKISEGNKGKKLSKDHIEIIINSNKNRVVSEKTKLKMSLSKLKMSNETKNKISLNNKKSRIVLNKNTGVFYNSIKEASFYECISYDKLKNISRKNGYKNDTNLIIT